MSVPSETSATVYSGNGVTTAFPVGFSFLADSEVKVTLTAPGLSPVLQTPGLHYAVVGSSVVFSTAPVNMSVIQLERQVPFTQPISFRTQGSFSPSLHEQAFDHSVMLSQDLARRVKALETVGGAGAGELVAGAGLTLSGSTLNVVAGAGILVTENAVQLDLNDQVVALTAAAGYGGVSGNASRSDHRHQVLTGIPGPVAALNPSEGGASSLSRSDHAHPHGNLPGGTLHALATTSTPGFLSGPEKQWLINPFAYAVTKSVNATYLGEASMGTSLQAAKADHTHLVETDGDGSETRPVSDNNIAGNSTHLAKADHQHAHGNQQPSHNAHTVASVIYTGGYPTTTANGFMSGADKVKLDGIWVEGETAPAPVVTGAGAPGTSTGFSRADHVHALVHGAQTDPAHHALVSNTAHGFMSNTQNMQFSALLLWESKAYAIAQVSRELVGSGISTDGMTLRLLEWDPSNEIVEVAVVGKATDTDKMAVFRLSVAICMDSGTPIIRSTQVLHTYQDSGGWMAAVVIADGKARLDIETPGYEVAWSAHARRTFTSGTGS